MNKIVSLAMLLLPVFAVVWFSNIGVPNWFLQVATTLVGLFCAKLSIEIVGKSNTSSWMRLFSRFLAFGYIAIAINALLKITL